MSSVHGQKCVNTVSMSSLNMLEGKGSKEEMMSRASGITAAAKGVIKMRQAMKLVGFS